MKYEGQLVYKWNAEEWLTDFLEDRLILLERVDYETWGHVLAIREEIDIICQELARRGYYW